MAKRNTRTRTKTKEREREGASEMNKGAQRDGEAQLGEERTTQNTQHTKAKRAKSVSRVLEERTQHGTQEASRRAKV
jgi:hypothetical protein